MSETALAASGLTVRYGKGTAVDHIDIDVPKGSVTALVGPNGAGKSSTMLALYGSVPSSGAISFNGNAITGKKALERARAGIAIVPQGRQLFPKMTVRENLSIMASLLKLPKASVDEAIDRFPSLREREGQLAGVLSGGEQQMLVVSRALMSDPKVLLLDEMMTGLAPKIIGGLVETIRELTKSGVAVLIADPTIGPLARVIDRGYVIVRGKVTVCVDDVDSLDKAYRAALGMMQDEVRVDATPE